MSTLPHVPVGAVGTDGGADDGPALDAGVGCEGIPVTDAATWSWSAPDCAYPVYGTDPQQHTHFNPHNAHNPTTAALVTVSVPNPNRTPYGPEFVPIMNLVVRAPVPTTSVPAASHHPYYQPQVQQSMPPGQPEAAALAVDDDSQQLCFRCAETGHIAAQCMFHKTRLCRYFMQGWCARVGTCQYAHGEHEMRTPWVKRCVKVVRSEEDGGAPKILGCRSTGHTYRECPDGSHSQGNASENDA